ncbi:MAG TPA: ABC transporter permease [Thermoanaerobaculia bacterium]|nr:ABC transporter permease [Thermoanaerobaculia bacterium]
MLSSPTAPSSAARNLHLLHQLVRRDFAARFTGSALGLGWAVLQPLTLVVLYWFVFTFMIPQGPGAGENGYVFFLISGLVPWIGFNEGILRSTTSIVDNSSIVKRLAFRSELLVAVPNASAIIFELIGIALFLIFLGANRFVSPMLWVLPFAIVLQFAIQVGAGWFLAALYVFFRDLAQVLGFVLSIVFYLSPILYPVSHRFESFFLWNPLTPLLGLFRSAMTGASLPPAMSIVFLMIVAAAMFTGGLAFFRRTQATLADLV